MYKFCIFLTWCILIREVHSKKTHFLRKSPCNSLSFPYTTLAIRLRDERSGVRIPVEARHFIFSITSRQPGAHPDSHSVRTEVVSRGLRGRGVNITTHFHLVSRLRMSGAILLLLRYNLTAWTGKLYFDTTLKRSAARKVRGFVFFE